MNVAELTDEDIETLCLGKTYGDKLRDDLRAQRFEARYELSRQAALEAHFAAIEDEMTDARQPKMVEVALAISADRMAGKTSLLLFLLDAMADAGLLSVKATKAATENPLMFLGMSRSVNDDLVEVIDIDIDLNALAYLVRQ